MSISRSEAIERIISVFADTPSGPDGYDILLALGIPVDRIESTATLTFTRECSLCGGDMHVINGERRRHICRLPK